jgi:hypothetical protein
MARILTNKEKNNKLFQEKCAELPYDAIVVNCPQYDQSWRYMKARNSLMYLDRYTIKRVLDSTGYAHGSYLQYSAVPGYNVLVMELDTFLSTYCISKKLRLLKAIKDFK